MEEREKLKNQILQMLQDEIKECREKSGFIVDKIDTEALIKIHNKILKL